MTDPVCITSRDNALLVKLRKLVHDPGGYRKLGQVWVEGDHLCAAARDRGWRAAQAVISEAGWHDASLRELALSAAKVAVVPDALFKGISALESPPRIGFLLEPRIDARIEPGVASIVLDRLQDAGNVGSILRSAAAFGVRQVLALKGTAALWSPKVLRAGMGAHFALGLAEGLAIEDLVALELPLLATSSHAQQQLADVQLPLPAAWVLGHEGQGVQPALLQRCALTLRIAQPGGEESLNVAAAAAVCLYEAARQAAEHAA